MSATGSRLRKLREDRGLTQAEVANRLGIQRVTYLKYETGENKPVRKLNELAKFFNVSIDYLLCNEDKHQVSEMSYMSEEEIQLIKIYRKIPEDKRLHAINIFRTVAASFVGS